MILSQRELNRALLARQGLLERFPPDLPGALRRIGGIQAQYAPAMYLGLWSRVADLERDAVTRALEDRSVIQATLLRSTIHLVAADDFWPWAVAVRSARREGFLRGRPDAPAAPAMARAARRLRSRLADGPLLRRDVEALLGKEAARGVGLWLDLVRVPPLGTWERRRADLYGLAEDWLPPVAVSQADAVEHVIRSYLSGFGPAPRGDIANWAGLKLGDVKPALERDGAPALPRPGRRRAARPARRPAPRPGHTGAGPLPARLGRDAARPRASHADPARGAPPAGVQHQACPTGSRRSWSTGRWRAHGGSRRAGWSWSRSFRWTPRRVERSRTRVSGWPRSPVDVDVRRATSD